MRSTGLAISYTIAAIGFAGFTPALMAWATRYTLYAPGIYVALAVVVSFAAFPAMLRLVAEQEALAAA